MSCPKRRLVSRSAIGNLFLLWQPPVIAAFTWSMGRVLKKYFPVAKRGGEWQQDDFRRAMHDEWKSAKRMNWKRRLRRTPDLSKPEIPPTLDPPIESRPIDSLPSDERRMLVIIDDGQSTPPISTELGLVIARRKSVANLKFFPGGRAEQNTLYVGHPYRDDVYYAAPDFHRELCKSKSLELIELLRSLGASDILLEEEEGFRCERDIQADVGLAAAGVGVELHGRIADRTRSERAARRHFQFQGKRAETASKGVWYEHEEEWQSYVKWRDDGLGAFDVEYRYANDFGVNAEVVGAVSKLFLGMAKIGLKGAHATFRETTWHLKVQFAATNAATV